MKQWEDWIIFLGFEDREYDNTVTAVKKNGMTCWPDPILIRIIWPS